MIRFIDGDVVSDKANVDILLAGKEEYKGIGVRDDNGDMTITVDFNVPEDGTSVRLILTKENDATFLGKFCIKETEVPGADPLTEPTNITEYYLAQ